MAIVIILGPLIVALAAFLLPSDRWRPWLLPAAAIGHLAATFASVYSPPAPLLGGWLVLDPAGQLVLMLVSVLFALCAFYTVGYLRHHPDRPNRIFCACLLAFLGTMGLIAWSHHLGLMWVAVEATTLASAPLIYHDHSALSLEATWKYLLICSVGIALALLGSFFLAYASLHEGMRSTLLFGDLLAQAPRLSRAWLHAAFVLLLVGYGTKMGLAPMHTWLPDAHSEAPTPVSAMLSGAAPVRLPADPPRIRDLPEGRRWRLCPATALAHWAAVGWRRGRVHASPARHQADARLFEHRTHGHPGDGHRHRRRRRFGGLLHIFNHGFTKALLFLAAGNIVLACGSKKADEIGGAMRRVPLSAGLFLVGLFAITGSPPFGPFVSEFTILSAAFLGSRYIAATLFLVLLLVIFIGMGRTVLLAIHGKATPQAAANTYRDGLLTTLPVIVLMGLVLVLGVYVPAPLSRLIHSAVQFLEV